MREIYKLVPMVLLGFGCASDPDAETPQPGIVARTAVSGGFCATAGNGIYCGNSTQNGFGGNPDLSQVLITCDNNEIVDGTTCGASCTIESNGSPDRCNPDPCTGVSSANDGKYCGTETQSGFNNQNASLYGLYSCSNHHTTFVGFCRFGCIIEPPGTADKCAPRPPM